MATSLVENPSCRSLSLRISPMERPPFSLPAHAVVLPTLPPRGSNLRFKISARSSRVRAAAEGSSPARPLKPQAPVAAPPRPPSAPAAPSPPAPPPQQATVALESGPSATAPAKATSPAVSMEYQRQMAKDLVNYFQEKKFEDVSQQGRVFGWTRKNEIGNGRWVMFGLLVGLLTEYATGVNFPSQIALVLENLGVID